VALILFSVLESTNNTGQQPESFASEVSGFWKFWDAECEYGVENCYVVVLSKI